MSEQTLFPKMVYNVISGCKLVRQDTTRRRILKVLADGVPRSLVDIARLTGLRVMQVSPCLGRCWRVGWVLRSRQVVKEPLTRLHGRAGLRRNLRSYYHYLLGGENEVSVYVDGIEYVGYDRRFLDNRGQREGSKAQLIKLFLMKHQECAFFSTEIVKALKDQGVKIADVMPTIRRLEKKGYVYVRGYRSHDRETPFHRGYIVTWLTSAKSREEALASAIACTNSALEGERSTNPVLYRIHLIKDIIFESSKLRELTGYAFLQNKLGVTKHKLRTAVERALQLYPELHEVKQLGVFKYYYHDVLGGSDLDAALELKLAS